MKAFICLLSYILLFSVLPSAQAQEYGKMRSLHKRATYVTKQKNAFVARVLASYQIPHERSNERVVIRINWAGVWLGIKTVDFVPIITQRNDN